MGLTAGPVPPRVDGDVKAGLLDLVDHAVERGWSAAGMCPARAGSRPLPPLGRPRRSGRLDDLPPGVNPLHAILEAKQAAVIKLFETWGHIDRSHRKLAHRGSRIGLVHVSESTVRRVLADEGLILPGPPPREPTPRPDWPQWLDWKPNRIWAYDLDTAHS